MLCISQMHYINAYIIFPLGTLYTIEPFLLKAARDVDIISRDFDSDAASAKYICKSYGFYNDQYLRRYSNILYSVIKLCFIFIIFYMYNKKYRLYIAIRKHFFVYFYFILIVIIPCYCYYKCTALHARSLISLYLNR